MRPHEFDRISRPERDALEFIQKQVGELATVKATAIQMMATQMADNIRGAVDSGMEYGTALDQAKHRWKTVFE